MALAAGVAAAAPLIVNELRERHKQRAERVMLLGRHLRLWDAARRGRLTLVHEVRDPTQLGVKPTAHPQNPQQRWLPTYLPRTIDTALDQVLVAERFVLVVGESAAGKSRSAFEAACRRFPDRAVVVPTRRDSLPALVDSGVEFQRAVVWLDDLDAYLGPDGFTRNVFERLVGAGDREVTVLATMRSSVHEIYAAQTAGRYERETLAAATVLRLEPRLNPEEQREAEHSPDVHLRAIVGQLGEYGLGEYLAAGPELVRRLENARSADSADHGGAAIVFAAVDWRRAGLTRPVPTEILRQLFELYLDERLKGHLPADARQDAFREGLAWALTPVVATSTLLVEEVDGYQAVDYLVDYVERSPTFPLRATTLERIGKLVSPDEAYKVGIAAMAAYVRVQVDSILQVGVMNTTRAMSAGDIAFIEAARATLAQLPADTVDFTGRSSELLLLREAFEEHYAPSRIHAAPIAMIMGAPGVGKTALAIHLAHELMAMYPDAQLYVNLAGRHGEPRSHDEVLVELLRSLGVPDEVIPDEIDARAALWRSQLAGRRALMVFDNAASEAQVQALLPGHSQAAVLVTSRRQLSGLPGAMALRLDVLTQDEAMALLARVVDPQRVEAEPEAARRIAAVCGYLPLALRIAGARLVAQPHLRLATFADRLTDERRRLDELSIGDLEIRASFGLSHDQLNQQEQSVFQLLALLDTPVLDPQTIGALMAITADEAAGLLDRLVDAQLVLTEPLADGVQGYRLQDLLRVYAGEQMRKHLRAEPHSSPARVTVEQDTQTAPTFTVRLEPHADIGIQTLNEVGP